jgi:hypothetical protein
LCIKLVIETSLYYNARSEKKHKIMEICLSALEILRADGRTDT